jgi:prevent-host-death family protein
MTITNIHEAKTHLSRLIEQALAGEEVIISKAGKPLVKLIPYEQNNQPRRPGSWRGQVTIAADFDELSAEFLQAFQGDETE